MIFNSLFPTSRHYNQHLSMTNTTKWTQNGFNDLEIHQCNVLILQAFLIYALASTPSLSAWSHLWILMLPCAKQFCDDIQRIKYPCMTKWSEKSQRLLELLQLSIPCVKIAALLSLDHFLILTPAQNAMCPSCVLLQRNCIKNSTQCFWVQFCRCSGETLPALKNLDIVKMWHVQSSTG